MKNYWLAVALLFVGENATADEVSELLQRFREGELVNYSELSALGPDALPELTEFMLNPKEPIFARIAATHAVGEIGGTESVPGLVEALKHEALLPIPIDTLKSLGRDAKDAVPQLTTLLVDERLNAKNRFIGDEIAQALGEIGAESPGAISALTRHIRRRRSQDAAAALTKLGEPGAEALLSLASEYAQLEDRHSHTAQKLSVAYLALIVDPLPEKMMPALVRHIKKNDETSEVAAQALAAVGKPAVETAFELLRSDNARVRRLAAEALSRMNWNASAARQFRNEPVEDPVPHDRLLDELKQLWRNSDGSVDEEMLRLLVREDLDVLDNDDIRSAYQVLIDRGMRESERRWKEAQAKEEEKPSAVKQETDPCACRPVKKPRRIALRRRRR